MAHVHPIVRTPRAVARSVRGGGRPSPEIGWTAVRTSVHARETGDAADLPLQEKRGSRRHGSLTVGPTDDKGSVAKEGGRSEEHTSELQSLMRTSYAVFC